MSAERTRAQQQPPRPGGSRASAVASAVMGLYPAAWRDRYRDEVRALLEDSGADLRTVASLGWHLCPAWLWPARHLHDRPARMRASLATVLLAWTALAGLAIVFAALTQAQPSVQRLTLARHPVIQWAYWAFDGAIGVSVLAVAIGGLPLWLQLTGRARREHRRRDLTFLLAPVVVPACYLAASLITVSIVRQPAGIAAGSVLPWQATSIMDTANGMIGPWWFLALIILGFAVGGVSAAGPGLALRRLSPGGPAVRRAARAAGLAAVTAGLAGIASIVAAVSLYQWAPPDVGYHQVWPLGIYLPLVALAAVVAAVSAARGVRATRSPAAA